ncbi:hypothetical protein P9112_001091 [Eukaryota sp. TZLM1-RC]
MFSLHESPESDNQLSAIKVDVNFYADKGGKPFLNTGLPFFYDPSELASLVENDVARYFLQLYSITAENQGVQQQPSAALEVTFKHTVMNDTVKNRLLPLA